MKKGILSILLILGITGHTLAVITRNYAFTFTIPDFKTMRIITPGVANGIIVLRMYTTQAGESVQSQTESVNSVSWLQLTSIAPSTENRVIKVQIANSGIVPPGTTLKLKATGSTTGEGDRGDVSANAISLSTINQTLISGIGSCYTGTTNTSGYNLTYTWAPDPLHLGDLKAYTSYQLQITFTFTTSP